MASTFKSHASEDGGVMIRGMASTNHSDRAGDVIAAEAWTKGGLENFQNNPVILFNHDYDKPIGRATGVKVTDSGLELEAKISKAAPANVAQLVKDGVLGAFSVGFKVKDADYIKETDGLMIKDAELFEVSVVSVPCNQAATFSLSKSFDSIEEYNEFKKTFTNRVDLTGQSLTKDDSKESKVVSDAPKQVEKSTIKETKMSEEIKTPEIDLEAFAKKVAEDTAAKIAMKQAEQKAAEEAEEKAKEAQALEVEKISTSIKSGIQTGVEKLEADMKADFEAAKEAEVSAVIKKYESDLAEKGAELEAMRNSKRDFSKGTPGIDGRKALEAKVMGAITGKGWDTAQGRNVMEKAGVDFGTLSTSGNLDIVVSTQFEKEVEAETKVAGLFQEIQVASGTTIMPFSAEANAAGFVGPDFDIGVANNRIDNGSTNGQFDVTNNVLKAYRLAAGTFIDNDVDEQALVGFLPMLTSALSRSHARAFDTAVLYGNGNGIKGLAGGTGTEKSSGLLSGTTTVTAQLDGTPALTSSMLLSARADMGKYGLNPGDLAYIVSVDAYYDLMEDDAFLTVDKAGSDFAANINGQLGTLFGSPVIVSDILAPGDAGVPAVCVNTTRYVVPRLRGVSIETDYQVSNQRNILVASQSLGFNGLEGTSGAQSLVYTANA